MWDFRACAWYLHPVTWSGKGIEQRLNPVGKREKWNDLIARGGLDVIREDDDAIPGLLWSLLELSLTPIGRLPGREAVSCRRMSGAEDIRSPQPLSLAHEPAACFAADRDLGPYDLIAATRDVDVAEVVALDAICRALKQVKGGSVIERHLFREINPLE